LLGGNSRPTIEQLQAAQIPAPAGPDGKGIALAAIAKVRVVPAMASGMADVDGATPAVGGIVVAKRGADVRQVIANVKLALDRERSRLPAGSKLGVVYDRSELAQRVEHTLLQAVAEEV